MEIIMMVIMATANIACFLVGAKIGQTVSKGEEIKLEAKPTVKSTKMSIEEARTNALLHNINAYDGTSRGQRDIP